MESRTRQLSLLGSGGVIAAAMALSACAPKESKTAVKYLPNDVSCQFQPTDGDAAIESFAEKLETFFFQKKIDSGKIARVYHTSGTTTVQQMQNEGIDVRGLQRPETYQCSRYTFLRAASSDMNSLWQAMQSDMDQGQIAGMFLPEGTLTGGVYFDKPTAIFGYDTDRSVLVHEYMHYLYDQEARKLPNYLLTQKLAREYYQLKEDLGVDDFEKSKLSFTVTRVKSGQNLKNLNRYLELVQLKLLGYALEEIAIEAKFFDDFSDGRYSSMPDVRENSLGYMAVSYEVSYNQVKSVMEFMSAFSEKMKNESVNCQLSSSCKPNPDNDPRFFSEVSSRLKNLKDLVSEAESATYQRYLKFTKPNGITESTEETSPGIVTSLSGMSLSGTKSRSFTTKPHTRCGRSLDF